MKQSGVIFTAPKPVSVKMLFFALCTTLSLLFFAFHNNNISRSEQAVAQATQSTVAIKSMQFTPAQLTVPAGTTVVWMNQEASTPHTVTSDTGIWDSGTLQPGQSFSHTFSSPGTFSYHCNIHPFMHGTIVVTGATTPTQQVTQTPIPMQIPTVTTPTPETGYQIAPPAPTQSIPVYPQGMQVNMQPPFVMMQTFPAPSISSSIQSQISGSVTSGNSTSAICANIQSNNTSSANNNCNLNNNQQQQ